MSNPNDGEFMRTLYQFPLSHFCEKARWLLDHKELEYVAQNLTPGVHRAFAQLKTGQNYLPILKDQHLWLANSTQIALYLDEQYPEHPLLSHQPSLRKNILDINEMANELGQHVRIWGLAQVLASEHAMDILIGEKGYLRRFAKYSKPLMKSVLFKGYQLDEHHIVQAKSSMDVLVDALNQIYIKNAGAYLVGQRFSLADIAVCSMLAPILEITGTPWDKEGSEAISEAAQEYKNQLLNMPLGQYVVQMYMQERHARVDWRGV